MSSLRNYLGLAAVGLVLAACSDSSGPGTSQTSLTAAEAQNLGDEVAFDVSDLADGFLYDASTGMQMSVTPPGQANISVPPPPCVTISPNPPTNTDGDAVPDSVRFNYADCGFSRMGGLIIDSLTGTIDILDPLPATPSIGVRHVFTDFGRKRINNVFPLRSFSALFNGTREWGGSPDTLGHTITNFVSTWTHAGGRTTTHTRNWVGKFTADVPGSIQAGSALPAGTWTVNGTGSWASGLRTWSVQVTTVTPMHYNPACNALPRFDAGEVDVLVTRGAEHVMVNIVFTACGQYTVTRTPVP